MRKFPRKSLLKIKFMKFNNSLILNDKNKKKTSLFNQ